MFTHSKFCAVAASVLFLLLQGCGKSEVSSDSGANGGGQTSKSTVGAAAPTSSSDSIAPGDVVGSWTAGAGTGTIVELPDGSFKLTNESNMVANGRIAGGALECRDWNVTGRVSQDKRSLVWSNGVIWTR